MSVARSEGQENLLLRLLKGVPGCGCCGGVWTLSNKPSRNHFLFSICCFEGGILFYPPPPFVTQLAASHNLHVAVRDPVKHQFFHQLFDLHFGPVRAKYQLRQERVWHSQ